jgi:hypothetical protein
MPPGTVVSVQCEIDLRPGKYQSSLKGFRDLLDSPSKGSYLFIAVRTPSDQLLEVQVQRDDIYVIAFKGAEGWYTFDDAKGGLGKSCGSGSNYAQLGTVGNVVLQDLRDLGQLSAFQKGVTLNKRLLAILFSVVSEATRFATAATYYVAITNGILATGMNFEYMKTTYFNNWTKPPDENLEIGKVYHYTKSDILVPRNRT